MTNLILIYSTFPDSKIAEELSQKLVSENLVACANILGEVKSIYKWQGKIEKSSEILAIFKTKKENFAKVETVIKSIHPYENPCIISLEIDNISKEFLNWILENTNIT